MTRGVLVEYEDRIRNEIYGSSGLSFGGRYVLITSNVLSSYLKEKKLDHEVKRREPGVLHVEQPNGLKLKVIAKNGEAISFKEGKAIASFVCRNILNSIPRYLFDWTIDVEEKHKQVKELLALFYILEVGDCNRDFNDLRKALRDLWVEAEEVDLTRGKDVFIESTPFGHRDFLNSYSQGIVSNVFGNDNCFVLSDCPSSPGSEGGLMYCEERGKKRVFAIIVSSLSWWKGEWIGLTLGANLAQLLAQLVPTGGTNLSAKNASITTNLVLLSTVNKSLVQVVCGGGWGTAIVLNANKGILITNSHVIETNRPVRMYWRSEMLNAEVVYKTPDSAIYDLAVLKTDPRILKKIKINSIKLSLSPPKIGERIYSAGFPLFSKDLKPDATISKGYISHVTKSMLKTTCCIHPGASGGAILRPEGNLVGIAVSNTKIQESGVIYPRANMSIPILAVHEVLNSFLNTGDRQVLNKLHCTDVTINKEWTFISGKL